MTGARPPDLVSIDELDDAEMAGAVAATVAAAGVTLDELRRQAPEGRFTSERARRARFVVSPFLGPEQA